MWSCTLVVALLEPLVSEEVVVLAEMFTVVLPFVSVIVCSVVPSLGTGTVWPFTVTCTIVGALPCAVKRVCVVTS